MRGNFKRIILNIYFPAYKTTGKDHNLLWNSHITITYGKKEIKTSLICSRGLGKSSLPFSRSATYQFVFAISFIGLCTVLP